MVMINDCEKEAVGIQSSIKTENKLTNSVPLLCQILFVVEIYITQKTSAKAVKSQTRLLAVAGFNPQPIFAF